MHSTHILVVALQYGRPAPPSVAQFVFVVQVGLQLLFWQTSPAPQCISVTHCSQLPPATSQWALVGSVQLVSEKHSTHRLFAESQIGEPPAGLQPLAVVPQGTRPASFRPASETIVPAVPPEVPAALPEVPALPEATAVPPVVPPVPCEGNPELLPHAAKTNANNTNLRVVIMETPGEKGASSPDLAGYAGSVRKLYRFCRRRDLTATVKLLCAASFPYVPGRRDSFTPPAPMTRVLRRYGRVHAGQKHFARAE
jgi:hypothetical protein